MEGSRDNERILRETHRFLSNLHGAAISILESCAEYRFEVEDPDVRFDRITGGGNIVRLEEVARKILDEAQKAHVNVRMAMDCIEGEDDGD